MIIHSRDKYKIWLNYKPVMFREAKESCRGRPALAGYIVSSVSAEAQNNLLPLNLAVISVGDKEGGFS
jgi:hypothetical protein